MPRELRKRGKKNKKAGGQPEDQAKAAQDNYQKSTGEPSWIISAPEVDETPPDAPFGYVDPDVKAYFRTVDEQIRAWQENESPADNENEDLDPNEAKRLFFIAALNEMSGKEKQLATDPDCSVILERMAHSMDDFVRRVFLDSLSGSFEPLLRHRFASHVCQTFFSIAATTVSRETRGILPDVTISEDKGELRTLTQLVLDICEELRPHFTSLIMDPFASHVLRSLLFLLCPNVLPEDQATQKFVRSKKSTSWKAKQGAMKSVFSDDKGKDREVQKALIPSHFSDAAAAFLRILRQELNENEIRALAANKVASPLLQLVLEVEADQGYTSTPGSIMDRVLVGMITAYHEDPEATPEPSDYLVTLLRDPTSSHLLETLVSRCPEQIFNLLWSTYFHRKLARLALHPVANFVVATACERLHSNQLSDTLKELYSSWKKMIKSSRTRVLRTLIDRSGALGAHESDVCEAVFTALELPDLERRSKLVPCALALKSLQEYMEMLSSQQLPQDVEHKKKPGRKTESEDPREPKVQGALILQSLLRLAEPHCSVVVDSIGSLSVEELIVISHHPTSSRVIDVLFESPTVSFKAKRRLVMSLIGHYHTLVDDRIGSRIGDRCWTFADPYLREKVARSLIPYEQFLAASFYGKFFARNLNLYLLQRRPEDWKTLQADSKASTSTPQPTTEQAPSQPSPQRAAAQPGSTPTETQKSKPSKKRSVREDEIDTLFNAALGTKKRRAAVAPVASHEAREVMDKELGDVLGAIRATPGGERGHAAKKRKR
ncbi:armadillo-type protein [Phlebopus sp. FC_14]|nr:armadillo-type protein [Phlebopus sp. FC_14]